MHNYTRLFYLFLLACTLSAKDSYATHAAGAELYCDWVSDSTYRLTYVFYVDCSGSAGADVSVSIGYQSISTAYANTITLTRIPGFYNGLANGSDINYLYHMYCAGQLSTCASSSGTVPGIKEWIYSGTVTLPYHAADWTFKCSENARTTSIVNLVNPSGAQLSVTATLNNLQQYDISLPHFTTEPRMVFCVNEPAVFNNNVIDSNGDSIVVTNVRPISCTSAITDPCDSNSAIPYVTGYTLDNPIASSTPYTVDPITGNATFTPTTIGKFVIVFKCSKYDRASGTLLGSVTRDRQVFVVTCTLLPPTIDSFPTNIQGVFFSASTGDTLLVYPNSAITMNVSAYTNPSTDQVYLSATPVANTTFDVPANGTNAATGTFTWTPTLNDTGDHLITFRAVDSTCGIQTMMLDNSMHVVIRVLSTHSHYCYSSSTGGATDTSDIGRFSIGSYVYGGYTSHVLNPTATNDYWYYRGSNDTISLYADSTYPIMAAGIMPGINDALEKITLFIDYNNNNQYDIPGERVWTAYTSSNSFWVDTSITIPDTVVTDVPTGMRLILNNDTGANAASDDACGIYTSGETQDFIVVFKRMPTIISNVNYKKTFSVFPNPARNDLYVTLNADVPVKQLQVAMTNITGQTVLTNSYSNTGMQFTDRFDVSNLAKGLYFITINADGEKQTMKVVIR